MSNSLYQQTPDVSNLLKLSVRSLEVSTVARMRGGIIESYTGIQVSGYDIDSLINQLCEEYGGDALIKCIKEDISMSSSLKELQSK